MTALSHSREDLLAEVASYYTDKLLTHGESPRGVDWNSEASQTLRFAQLCKIVDTSIINAPYSLNDLGCGYGALYEYLKINQPTASYVGIDISEVMIKAAQRRYWADAGARFLIAAQPDRMADYGVASGIFNVRLGRDEDEWLRYLEASLDSLDGSSRLGFSFNCLTAYSDTDKRLDYLYYADPCHIFDLCKRKYSKQVALLHDYGLFEFTILVRKVP
jgi:SAM-dependent methyltransferase